jgi:hypothetical protein
MKTKIFDLVALVFDLLIENFTLQLLYLINKNIWKNKIISLPTEPILESEVA